mmetsp:Transcript_2038/g.5727  ORF Transcript_2038/g.5727 Transcript_2038/m.5727 type:complete len:105 (+) Transcript_2038:413-727(+)
MRRGAVRNARADIRGVAMTLLTSDDRARLRLRPAKPPALSAVRSLHSTHASIPVTQRALSSLGVQLQIQAVHLHAVALLFLPAHGCSLEPLRQGRRACTQARGV